MSQKCLKNIEKMLVAGNALKLCQKSENYVKIIKIHFKIVSINVDTKISKIWKNGSGIPETRLNFVKSLENFFFNVKFSSEIYYLKMSQICLKNGI